MAVRVLSRAFSAGEITPELIGRIDLTKRQEGLSLARNFQILPHGPAINRPGTEFVREVKNSSVATRIIPFSYNNTQTFIIEVGAGYFRFHTNAATLFFTTPAGYSGITAYNIGDMVLSGGIAYYCIAPTTGNAPPNATYWYAMPTNPNIYEIPNPFVNGELFDIHYVQSADVLTLVHPNHPPLELRRMGATNWQLSTPGFAPPANVLTGLTATPTGAGATVYTYCMTTVATVGLQESVASSTFTCSNDLTIAGHSNAITFTDPSSAGTNVRYNVYKLANGILGYIGQTAPGGSFTDNNITPDTTRTPPISDSPAVFSSSNNYPQGVSYFQQRRCFAGTVAAPQNFWATRSGTESNMSYSIPALSDNRIAIRIAAREASAIRHIVPAGNLLLLSATCEWRCTADASGGVLTPASISIQPQSYVGSSNVQPVLVNNIVIFAAARGGHLREMSYSWQASSYVTGDLSLLAPHLFDYYTILDMAFSRGPIPTIWAVSSNGSLLGSTYVPEQQVIAWHHHDTAASGIFEACAVITENNEDMLYVVVNRTINGATKRYIERLHTRLYNTLADAFFVDSGAQYYRAGTFTVTGTTMTCSITAHGLTNGNSYSFAFSDNSYGAAPSGTAYTITVVDANTFTITVAAGHAASGTLTQQITTLSGITWLEGQTVNVLADGAVQNPKTVTGGAITLDNGAAKVNFGLPITAQLQTLPVMAQSDSGFAQGRAKNVNKIWVRLYRSSGLNAGPDFNNLTAYPQRTNEPWGTPPNMVTDEVELVLTPSWGQSGQVAIQQTDPLPMDVASITAEVAMGA